MTAADRRAHEREAAAYFGDPGLSEHVRQLGAFAAALMDYMLEHGERMREFAEGYVAMRERMGLPAVDVEQVTYARAAEIVTTHVRRVDLLTSRDVAVAVRNTKAQSSSREAETTVLALGGALVTHIARHADRLSNEAKFENRARRQRGRPGASLESIVVQLATQEVLEVVATNRLTVEDARRAGRIARSTIDAPVYGLPCAPRERGLPASGR